MSGTLSLENIRSSLIRQEDTIIFNIIERAQFARNDAIYRSEAISVPGGCRLRRMRVPCSMHGTRIKQGAS